MLQTCFILTGDARALCNSSVRAFRPAGFSPRRVSRASTFCRRRDTRRVLSDSVLSGRVLWSLSVEFLTAPLFLRNYLSTSESGPGLLLVPSAVFPTRPLRRPRCTHQ